MTDMLGRWRPIALSGKQRKAMDRVGGAELILPWPPGLPDGTRGEPLALDEERDATPEERAAAEQIVGPACEAAGLVPVQVSVARLNAPPDLLPPNEHMQLQRRQWLIVQIVGRRWVHASTRQRPRGGQCWYAGDIEPT